MIKVPWAKKGYPPKIKTRVTCVNCGNKFTLPWKTTSHKNHWCLKCHMYFGYIGDLMTEEQWLKFSEEWKEEQGY